MTSQTNLPEIADVLIIGAGASGGVAARRLVDAGLSVVALEQGEWQDATQYRGAYWDWELGALKTWSSNPNVRQSPADYPVDVSDSDMGVINFNGVGGATILFNAVWMRLTPDDFRRRSANGVGDDWPISYEELQPFYERTDREIGVSGLAGDPVYPPPNDEFPLPPFNLRPGALKVARAVASKGWHWWPPTNAIITANYDGRRGCVLRGACQTGCNEGAKSSIDVTHWKPAVKAGCNLVTGARVRRILLDEGGLAAGAEWLDVDGGVHVQRARIVLCAANGVGTARLLLASAGEGHPDGLANSSGLVGRHLMLHPLAKVTGFFAEPLESWEGPFATDLTVLEFANVDRSRGHVAPVKWSMHHGGAGPVAEGLKVLTEQAPGGEHHARFRTRFGRTIGWTIMAEDMPDENNRVTLSPDLVDSSGLPAPKVRYRYNDDVLRALTWNVERSSDILRDAGAFEIETLNPGMADAHLMGTARMGDDPKTSVVDRWGMSHDVPNLGIIDGSIFVTASCVNPTSTICALALRTAERLIDTRAEWREPKVPVVPAAPAGRPRAEAPAPASPVFSAGERERLAALADALLPGDEVMPPASGVDVAGAGLDRVLSARPDLAEILHTLLAEPVSDPLAWLGALKDRSAADHRQLLIAVAGAYYTDKRIKDLVGYPGQPETPHRPDRGVPAYMEEGLLDHLFAAQ